MNTIAIIPARGGSKRIPNKNIKKFCGKPIISYSIDVAKKSGLFNEIIVSTDSDEIANISKDCGAIVNGIRPPKLADDFSTTDDVMEYEVRKLISSEIELSAVCCIYATAPFIRTCDLKNAYSIFTSNNCDYVFPIIQYSYPVQRALIKVTKNKISMLHPIHLESRSQDLPKTYHDAGQFYWGKPMSWVNRDNCFSGNSKGYELPLWGGWDIDTVEDWKMAEILFQVNLDQ